MNFGQFVSYYTNWPNFIARLYTLLGVLVISFKTTENLPQQRFIIFLKFQ